MMQTFLRLPKQHKMILGCSALFLSLALLMPSEDVEAAKSVASDTQRIAIPLPDDLANDDMPVITEPNIQTASVAQQMRVDANVPSQMVATDTVTITSTPVKVQAIEQVSVERSSSLSDSTSQLIGDLIPATDRLAAHPELLSMAAEGPAILEPGYRYALSLKEDLLADGSAEPLVDQPEWQSFRVQRGDNLAKVFSRAGLSAQEVHHVSHAGKQAKKLVKMMPGEELRILKSSDGHFDRLEYDFSETQTLTVHKQGEKYLSSVTEKEMYSRLNYASGTIDSSFWNAGIKSGLTDNQIMSLATIFGWDIDFALDIREGDHFNVIYEENYIDGEFVGYGDIVAAEFSNQGEQFSAILYTDGNYYTPEGRSMRKSFLRAPVSFKYISSNFKPKRFHPVLKRWKAHNGIDYAANSGTPVVASGDGRVIEAAFNKYNGNYVFIQHGDIYTTKYLHFTKRAVKKGQWVKQGQVIGYVGKTGLATAPHLHYEFLVNGKHQNPRTVALPKALPIARSEKHKFLELAHDYQEKLDMNRRIMLAMN